MHDNQHPFAKAERASGIKVDLLIPARDEEAALPLLLGEIDRSPLRRIVVVDNGSRDRTASLAKDLGCAVVFCPVPGYGRACLAGIDFLKSGPPDILVFLDGDRSDHPQHLPALLQPILDGDADLVLGSRTKGLAEKGSLTFTQRFGNALATTLMRWFWQVDYSDLAPFRAIRWQALMELAMGDQNYGWTIEMQIKAAIRGLRVTEVPVTYRKRVGTSKISGTLGGAFRAGTKILATIFRYRFGKIPRNAEAAYHD